MPYAGNEMLATTGPDGEKPNEVSDMLSYLSIGANDVEASAKFYDAVLLPLGYENDSRDEECSSYFLPGTRDRDNGPGTVHVGKPFDGKPATPGNGMTSHTQLGFVAGEPTRGVQEPEPHIPKDFMWHICATLSGTSSRCFTRVTSVKALSGGCHSSTTNDHLKSKRRRRPLKCEVSEKSGVYSRETLTSRTPVRFFSCLSELDVLPIVSWVN
jgi:hypothetical protein